MSALTACVMPGEPWEPPQESAEAQQAWQKARLEAVRDQWVFLEEQFVEWGPEPVEPPKPMFGGDDFNGGERPRPQQTPLQQEEDLEAGTPAEWSSLNRRQLFIYATKPTDGSAWIRFRLGWLARAGSRWSTQMDLQSPMRVRCNKGQVSDLQALADGRFMALAINAGLDGSSSGTANLQQLIPAFAGWICRQRQAAAVEALKPLVVER
jgi:hypothetical protein